jgi:hypothetical protein
MIGILCKNAEQKIVQEFFELFKTPWEFYVPSRSYEVVIASADSGQDALSFSMATKVQNSTTVHPCFLGPASKRQLLNRMVQAFRSIVVLRRLGGQENSLCM